MLQAVSSVVRSGEVTSIAGLTPCGNCCWPYKALPVSSRAMTNLCISAVPSQI
jgi:hypothetical protein